MKYPVKVIRSSMRAAPLRNGTPGTTIAMLDACLVNGFGEVTAISLVIADGVATATLNTNEMFEKGTTVWVSGAGLPSMNEEQRVTSITSNTISWKTLEANQTVTGTIKIKVASLGWLKPFAGTSKGVYQSANVLSTRTFVRVDDTYARSCKINAYELMTDVDTGFEQMPPGANECWWKKSSLANTTIRDWVIIGGDKWFYLFFTMAPRLNAAIPLELGGHVYFVGDYKKNPDFVTKNNFVLWGNYNQAQAEAEGAGTDTVGYCDFEANAATRSRWLRRSYTGVPGAARFYGHAHSIGSNGYSGAAFYVPYPNPTDGSLRLSDLNIYDIGNNHYGSLPSVKIVCHNSTVIYRIPNMGILPGTGGMLGRDILFMRLNNYTYSESSEGILAFDITGPFE